MTDKELLKKALEIVKIVARDPNSELKARLEAIRLMKIIDNEDKELVQ